MTLTLTALAAQVAALGQAVYRLQLPGLREACRVGARVRYVGVHVPTDGAVATVVKHDRVGEWAKVRYADGRTHWADFRNLVS